MNPQVFDFGITGTVPRTDAQIARAKQMAVGGKRKKCTKGKNCSAACIQADMICLVDLPWVVSSALSQTKQMIQSGGTSGAKPMVQWAGGGAAGGAPPPKQQTWAPNLPAAAPPAAPAAATPPATGKERLAPANVKVGSVEDYKKFGLIFLQDKALPEAEKYINDPKMQLVLKNMKEAIKQLEAEQSAAAAKAKAAAPATPPPAAAVKAPAPAPAAAPPTAAVKAPAPAPAAAPPTAAVKAPAPAPAAAAAPAPAPAKATPAANKPTPLIQAAEGNRPQQPSSENPHGLTQNQQIIWKNAFGPLTKESWEKYSNYDSFGSPKHKINSLKNSGDFDGARIARLLGAAHDNKFTEGLAKLYKGKLTPEEVSKLPKPLQDMISQHGQPKFRGFLIQVRNFTGNDYGDMRAVMQGKVPKGLDYLSQEERDKRIDKIRKNAEKVQQFLETSTVRPLVPKFRGIPADADRLKQYIDLAKTGGSFEEKAVNSWSTRPSTAISFTHSKGTANNRVIFRTMNKMGTSVRGGSQHKHENEILTPGRTRYKVVGHQEIENPEGGKGKVHVFDVVEY